MQRRRVSSPLEGSNTLSGSVNGGSAGPQPEGERPQASAEENMENTPQEHEAGHLHLPEEAVEAVPLPQDNEGAQLPSGETITPAPDNETVDTRPPLDDSSCE